MANLAIRASGLGKEYVIGDPQRYRALRDEVAWVASWPARRLWAKKDNGAGIISERKGSADKIWAIQNVTFDIEHGEIVGIIGMNGAGKSTLLKVLARITEPTAGSAEVYGRVGSLLEVGTGFHPELSGRENVLLSGAIMGMRKSEIKARFDQIVAFAGVERFIDMPVKRYSSGMFVRLAFGVAAHLDPEVLMVDEVLAVGDASFQQKCLGKIGEIARSGRTVLFVSHNLATIRSLCSRGILLRGGQVQTDGDAEQAIQDYLKSCAVEKTEGNFVDLTNFRERSGSGRVRIRSFRSARSCTLDQPPSTGADTDLVIEYDSNGTGPIVRLAVAIAIRDGMGNNVFGCTTGMNLGDFWNVEGSGTIVCQIKDLPLIPGNYKVDLLLKDDHGIADYLQGSVGFNVVDAGTSGCVHLPPRRWGNVVVPHEWRLE